MVHSLSYWPRARHAERLAERNLPRNAGTNHNRSAHFPLDTFGRLTVESQRDFVRVRQSVNLWAFQSLAHSGRPASGWMFARPRQSKRVRSGTERKKPFPFDDAAPYERQHGLALFNSAPVFAGLHPSECSKTYTGAGLGTRQAVVTRGSVGTAGRR